MITLLLRMDKPFEPFLQSGLYRQIVAHLDPRQVQILDNDWDDFRGIIKKDGLPIGHSFRAEKTSKATPCYALFRKMQVMMDGTMQACSCRVEPELWGGNIKSYDTLRNAWRDSKIETIRTNWFAGIVPSCCVDCSHYHPYTSLLGRFSFSRVVTDIKQTILRRALRR